MKTKNSINSPIYVVQVVQESEISSGWIGITLAPGKKTQGTFNYWDRDLDSDLDKLKELGTNSLIPFLEIEEMSRLGIPELIESARRRFEVFWFPFPDGGIPGDMETTIYLIQGVINRYKDSQKIVMHCNGGLGRAGTIAACARLAVGLDASPDEAIDTIRKLRDRRAIETIEQEEFITKFYIEWTKNHTE